MSVLPVKFLSVLCVSALPMMASASTLHTIDSTIRYTGSALTNVAVYDGTGRKIIRTRLLREADDNWGLPKVFPTYKIGKVVNFSFRWREAKDGTLTMISCIFGNRKCVPSDKSVQPPDEKTKLLTMDEPDLWSIFGRLRAGSKMTYALLSKTTQVNLGKGQTALYDDRLAYFDVVSVKRDGKLEAPAPIPAPAAATLLPAGLGALALLRRRRRRA